VFGPLRKSFNEVVNIQDEEGWTKDGTLRDPEEMLRQLPRRARPSSRPPIVWSFFVPLILIFWKELVYTNHFEVRKFYH